MIKDIQELNFPEYATLSQATATMQDMGERTITTQVRIDGAVAPDFSSVWAVVFRGEKYIHPLRRPQAGKENTNLRSTVDLTFRHWAEYQLRRWFFFTVQPVESGTAVPDKYIASVSLNLGDFCALFSQVLSFYYGPAITLDLNPSWAYDEAATVVEISHSYLWDVLLKLYELYAVRWQIEPHPDNDNEAAGGERYVIRVGYGAAELSHVFEYGFDGGLLKVGQQVQSDDIRNMMIGRGGSRNLPLRYFKDEDTQNPSFPADPDWVPELASIYFTGLRGATFRSYVQGWKARRYGGTAQKEQAYAQWAWEKGYADERFDPVEYVKDDESIALYGPLMGGLEDNEDIYPSIQGVWSADHPAYFPEDIGRIDEAVYVEQVQSDDVEQAAEDIVRVKYLSDMNYTERKLGAGKRKVVQLEGGLVQVPDGMHGNLDEGNKTVTIKRSKTALTFTVTVDGSLRVGIEKVEVPVENLGNVTIEDAVIVMVDTEGNEIPASGIPAGTYYPRLRLTLSNNTSEDLTVVIGITGGKLTYADVSDTGWGNTFDVWIKNVWATQKSGAETPEEYEERVWRPILGDREGNEAKVVFASGLLSTSEDYEFTIASGGVHYDTSRKIALRDASGNPTGLYAPSEWRLTLKKSEADLESTGLYLPSTLRQGKAGDLFFFTGIDMPRLYVIWAEERLDNYKRDELAKVSDIRPSWVVSLDKVRIANAAPGEAATLLSQLREGSSLTLFDPRFIPGSHEERLYLQSVTFTYREPTSSDAAIIPDVEVVLSDQYAVTANPVATLNGEVDALRRQLGSLSNVEQAVRAVADRLYLRKDGVADRSMSPTQFFSLLTSGGFRQGIVGGTGWGFFKDEDGAWVLETDRISVRQELLANTLVINQVEGRGGTIVESAARMEVERVVEQPGGYVCYFDQRDGTVGNLFRVDDVAWCNRFTPEDESLKYYKRRVVAVDAGSVTLTKGYDAVEMPDGTLDTGVSGTGVPEEGDIIVQFGSYTDPERRYVKVRDVIGGGYERYLEDLDSVNAAGTEYYFVGRRAGMYGDRPRWFIGGEEEYAEWVYGKLNIKGRVHVTAGSTGAANFDDLPEEIGRAVRVGGENLLRNTGFDGEYRSVEMSGAGTLEPGTELYGPPMELWEGDGESVECSAAVSGHAADLSGGRIIAQAVNLIPGESYMLSFRAQGTVEITAGEQSFTSAPPESPPAEGGEAGDGETGDVAVTADPTRRRELPLPAVPGGRTLFAFAGQAADDADADASGAQALLFDLKLERGTVATDWCPAREDADPVADRFRSYDYLQNAFTDGGTEILGGVILTSVINLGNPYSGSVSDVTAGVSGVYTRPDDIAFWAGGTLSDAIRSRSRIKAGIELTDEEWGSLVGFYATHGGDAFFKGWVNALGGCFRNITTPNGSFRVNEQGDTSLRNATIDFQYVHEESGEVLSNLRLAPGTTPLSVTDANGFVIASLGYFMAPNGAGYNAWLRLSQPGEDASAQALELSPSGIIGTMGKSLFSIGGLGYRLRSALGEQFSLTAEPISDGTESIVRIKATRWPTYDEAGSGELYVRSIPVQGAWNSELGEYDTAILPVLAIKK